MFKYNSLCKFKNYSLSEIKTKWSPPEGLFKNGSSLNIAREVWNSHDKDLKRSLSCINFYINRAGDNLDQDRLEVLEKAKDRIRRWDELESHNFSELEVVSMDPGNDSTYSEIIGINQIVPGVDDSKKSYQDSVGDTGDEKVDSNLDKSIDNTSNTDDKESDELDESSINSTDNLEDYGEDTDSDNSNEEKESPKMEENLLSNLVTLTDRITKLTESIIGKTSTEDETTEDIESDESTETTDDTEFTEDVESDEDETAEDTEDESDDEDTVTSNFSLRIKRLKSLF
jgi:hypothetical protein